MSSRNGYLSDPERAEAVQLYLTLCQMRESFKEGKSAALIEQDAMQHLQARGWKTDYLTIRSALDLTAVDQSPGHNATNLPMNNNTGSFVALGAARIGKTRLIDNLEF